MLGILSPARKKVFHNSNRKKKESLNNSFTGINNTNNIA
jgi:hypothetical protein